MYIIIVHRGNATLLPVCVVDVKINILAKVAMATLERLQQSICQGSKAWDKSNIQDLHN